MKNFVASVWICFLLGVGTTLPAWGFGGTDVPALKKQAEQGDANAEVQLGVMYSTGIGMKMDKKEAVKWYRKAADQGHPVGQWNLAFMYVRGEGGLEKDYRKAWELFRKSAVQGYSDAQYDLGMMYLQGLGVDADSNEAEKWFKLASDQGHREAKKILKELADEKEKRKP
jgi:TPR repeat protein